MGDAVLRTEVPLIVQLWTKFFPKDTYSKDDKRNLVVEAFTGCLQINFKNLSREVIDSIIYNGSIFINIKYLHSISVFGDFMDTLLNQPSDIISCLGISISCLLSRRLAFFNNGQVVPIPITPRLITTAILSRIGNRNADNRGASIPLTPYSELKSNVVGKLVCIIGYIVRVSKSIPMVEYAAFLCGKCQKNTIQYFEDGIFNPPTACRTKGCRGRYLELQRQQKVITQDTRFIKLQEIERYSRASSESRGQQGYLNEDESSRIPKTFEIECRGNHLINFNCGTGDILQVIGVVRSVQERPRYQGGGGGRGGQRQKAESGLHNITIIANSLTKLPTALLSVSSATSANSLYSHSYVTVNTGHNARCNSDSNCNSSKRSFDALNTQATTATATETDDVEFRRKCVKTQLLNGISRLLEKKVANPPHSTGAHAKFVIPDIVTGDADKNTNTNIENKHHSNPNPNPNCSKHKATGLFILDENFEGNTCIAGTVVGNIAEDALSRAQIVPTKTMECLIDIKAFETDDINSYSSGVDITNSNLFSSTDMNDIRKVAHLPSRILLPLLLNSFCPTIYGNELVKLGLLLGLLGGSSTDGVSGKGGGSGMHIRADIHVLMCGDPGLGKSQLLRAVNSIAPRCITVCGNSTTTAGLTVTLVREPGSTGNMSGNDVAMEAGALVLADKGICCIDELDKVNCDLHALLECMEQQHISIAKSGMITTLPARTAIFAAANPHGGHYNHSRSVMENIKLPSPLLSRFDLIFILVDGVDSERDKKISEHIMGTNTNTNINTSVGYFNSESVENPSLSEDASHIPNFDMDMCTLAQRLRKQCDNVSNMIRNRSTNYQKDQNYAYNPDVFPPSPPMGLLSSNFMRKYIEYAKTYATPRLTPAAAKVLQKFYLTMRSESMIGSGSIPVTTRNLESLIRLSQARAKAELRVEVFESDALDVIKLLQESLLDAFSSENGMGMVVNSNISGINKGSAITTTKVIKMLIQALTNEAKQNNNSIFSKASIDATRLKIINQLTSSNPNKPPDTTKKCFDLDALIDVMRTECYLILKGPKLYQLQTY